MKTFVFEAAFSAKFSAMSCKNLTARKTCLRAFLETFDSKEETSLHDDEDSSDLFFDGMESKGVWVSTTVQINSFDYLAQSRRGAVTKPRRPALQDVFVDEGDWSLLESVIVVLTFFAAHLPAGKCTVQNMSADGRRKASPR